MTDLFPTSWEDLDWENIDPFNVRYYHSIKAALLERLIKLPNTPYLGGVSNKPIFSNRNRMHGEDIKLGQESCISEVNKLAEFLGTVKSDIGYIDIAQELFSSDNTFQIIDSVAGITDVSGASFSRSHNDKEQIASFLYDVKKDIERLRYLILGRQTSGSAVKSISVSAGANDADEQTAKTKFLSAEQFIQTETGRGGTVDVICRLYFTGTRYYIQLNASDIRFKNTTNRAAKIYVYVRKPAIRYSTEAQIFDNFGFNLTEGESLYFGELEAGETLNNPVSNSIFNGSITNILPTDSSFVIGDVIHRGFTLVFYADFNDSFNFSAA